MVLKKAILGDVTRWSYAIMHKQCMSAGRRERMALNSADRTFRELRDMSFAAVGPRLNTRAKALQSEYKDSKVNYR